MLNEKKKQARKEVITLDKRLTYTIQQVAEMTGLSKQVIRKWEDRYSIIQPERLENGYRIYSREEVALLKKVVQYSNKLCHPY